MSAKVALVTGQIRVNDGGSLLLTAADRQFLVKDPDGHTIRLVDP